MKPRILSLEWGDDSIVDNAELCKMDDNNVDLSMKEDGVDLLFHNFDYICVEKWMKQHNVPMICGARSER